MEITAVLITGGCGFLGSHLAEFFLKQGKPVICVDNFSTGLRSNLNHLEKVAAEMHTPLQFIEADVSRPWSFWTDQITHHRKNISHIFHFASPASPPHYQRLSVETMWVNTIGLQEAMIFADSISARVIFASSSEVYGDPAVTPQPESYWGSVNTLGPRSCYDEAKRFGESLIYTHNKKYNTRHGLVRIFNTYGPRMNPSDGRVIINFLVQALRGRRLSVYGSGSQSRSFCYVDDLVDGIVRYAQSELTEPVNLGNETEFSVLELAHTVQEQFGVLNLELEHFPLPKDDPKQRRPDLSIAKSKLAPWSPKTSLKDGLQQFAAWLKQQDLKKYEIAERPQ